MSTPTHVPWEPYARVDFIPSQGLRIWLLAPVPYPEMQVLTHLYLFAFYSTTKWVCCLQTGFTAKEMLWGVRKCRRVDYLAIMKHVPIIARCWYRKCLPRFSHNMAITFFSHSSTDILFTKIMIYLSYFFKYVNLRNLHYSDVGCFIYIFRFTTLKMAIPISKNSSF
jgi:hypothetical protein